MHGNIALAGFIYWLISLSGMHEVVKVFNACNLMIYNQSTVYYICCFLSRAHSW